MKRYLVEFIGTFFLTLAIGLTGKPLAIAAMLVAIIYMGAHISGAHYNPALTFAEWARGKFSMDKFLTYFGAQLAGAFVAAAMLFGITQTEFMPVLLTEAPWWIACCFEAILTFLLAMVFLTVGSKKDTHIAGFVIGMALLAIAYIGGLFNPAVALGAFVFAFIKTQDFGLLMPMMGYIVGPLVGGFLAAHAHGYLNAGRK